MKRKIILLAFCLSPLIGNAQQNRLERYHVLPTKEAGSIIFVGDSITDDNEWGELFEDPNVLSRGIDGDNTAGILARTHELTRHQPSKVFFAIGTNDIAGQVPVDTIIQNMSKIVQLFAEESPDTKLYIQSVLPVGSNPMFIHSGHNNDGVLALNERYKQFCEENDITYIDLHSHFLGVDGYIDSIYTNDDLHIMGNGFLLWKNLVMDYVNK